MKRKIKIGEEFIVSLIFLTGGLVSYFTVSMWFTDIEAFYKIFLTGCAVFIDGQIAIG